MASSSQTPDAPLDSEKEAAIISTAAPAPAPAAEAEAATATEPGGGDGNPRTGAVETTPSSDDGNPDRKRRVYVGNLAWSVSWQDLKDLMKSTGHEVARSDIMMTPDGRSKGCGIVEFVTPEGAAEAVSTLNDIELKGRQIFVREDREDRGGGGGGGGGGGQRYHQHQQRTNYHQQYHRGGQSFGQRGGSDASGNNSAPDHQAQSCRVYVGNLSWDVTWQELKEHMKAAGEVVFAEVITEHNGRSKGCGVVSYATEEEAQQAIATLPHTELKGRNIFVREDREGSTGGHGGGGGGRPHNFSGGGNPSVYVWNLSYDTSWQDLKDHMRRAGNVDQATILADSNDGSSIGCGTVVYQKPQDAQRAIRELQESELNGRPIKLREDRIGGGRGGRHGGRGGRFGGRGGGGRFGGRGGYGGHNESIPEGTQLFVGNIPFETNWRDLKDHFSTVGEVQRVFVKTSDTGRSKGFATVRFAKKEDAETAINTLDGVEFQGRDLDVRLDSKV
ncbi:MAG: hypothetical protein SGILL_001510 [Bacillariaceae sp.]